MSLDGVAGTGLTLAIVALIPAALLRIKIFLIERGIRPVNRPYFDRDPVKRREIDAQLDEINERNARWTWVIVQVLLLLVVIGTVLFLVALAFGGRP